MTSSLYKLVSSPLLVGRQLTETPDNRSYHFFILLAILGQHDSQNHGEHYEEDDDNWSHKVVSNQILVFGHLDHHDHNHHNDNDDGNWKTKGVSIRIQVCVVLILLGVVERNDDGNDDYDDNKNGR